MKKIILLIAIIIFASTGCGKNTSEKMDSDTEKKYINMAEEDIKLIIDEGAKALDDKLSEEMKNAMKDDTYKEIDEAVQSKGAFKEFGQTGAVYYNDEKSGNKVIITQIETKYENGNFIFTVNYDLEDNIIGFFYK